MEDYWEVCTGVELFLRGLPLHWPTMRMSNLAKHCSVIQRLRLNQPHAQIFFFSLGVLLNVAGYRRVKAEEISVHVHRQDTPMKTTALLTRSV